MCGREEPNIQWLPILLHLPMNSIEHTYTSSLVTGLQQYCWNHLIPLWQWLHAVTWPLATCLPHKVILGKKYTRTVHPSLQIAYWPHWPILTNMYIYTIHTFIMHNVRILCPTCMVRNTCPQPSIGYHCKVSQYALVAQWNFSNPDIIGPEESVLFKEVSLFQRLRSTQGLYLGREICPVKFRVSFFIEYPLYPHFDGEWPVKQLCVLQSCGKSTHGTNDSTSAHKHTSWNITTWTHTLQHHSKRKPGSYKTLWHQHYFNYYDLLNVYPHPSPL